MRPDTVVGQVCRWLVLACRSVAQGDGSTRLVSVPTLAYCKARRVGVPSLLYSQTC